MKTNEDIEQYLIDMNMPYEKLGDGIWALNNTEEGIDNIIIMHSAPLIIFRVKLMPLPENNRAELMEVLLRLNAEEMTGGAYGIEGDNVVIIDSLQSENLDFNEFQGSIDCLSMAIREHYPILKGFRA